MKNIKIVYLIQVSKTVEASTHWKAKNMVKKETVTALRDLGYNVDIISFTAKSEKNE